MGIAQMALGGAVTGVYCGCIAEYTLSRGAGTSTGKMCRACLIGGEAGAFVFPVFYTKGNEQGYSQGLSQGKKSRDKNM